MSLYDSSDQNQQDGSDRRDVQRGGPQYGPHPNQQAGLRNGPQPGYGPGPQPSYRRPGQYSQGHGQPSHGQQPPARKSKAPLITAIVAVAIVCGALVSFFLLKAGGSDKPSASGSDPAATVKAYLQAAKANDLAAALKVVCPGSSLQSGIASAEGADNPLFISSYAVGKARITGTTADVPATLRLNGDTDAHGGEAVVFKTRKIDRKWLVCAIGADNSSYQPTVILPTESGWSVSVSFDSLAPGN